MIPYTWLEQAYERISPYINQTPLTYDEKNRLYLKWENHQVTGSFKARGALNKILALQDWELERGLIAASAGNHGQGVALAGKIKQAPVIVFASEHAQRNKLQDMRDLGAEIHLVPGGYSEAEQAGITYAAATRATWVSPYNDGMIIAGQGTIAMEVKRELPDISSITWVVPAGGGGLIAGIGCALQDANPSPRLIAVQSEASPFLYNIYHYGTQDGVQDLPSLADGLAGHIEDSSVTIPIVKNYVTDITLVTELEIRSAIQYAWYTYHERIEGSAAAALAAVISNRVPQRPALVVLTGGNIDPETHAHIINEKNNGGFGLGN
jgi:threonine dehydratase